MEVVTLFTTLNVTPHENKEFVIAYHKMKSRGNDHYLRAWLYEPSWPEITFSPVLHEVSQPGWWLMRWTVGDRSELAFGAKKAGARSGSCSWREVVVFKTDTTRMQRMIVIAFFQQLAVFFSAFMQLHGLLFLFLLQGLFKEYWFVGDSLFTEEKFIC